MRLTSWQGLFLIFLANFSIPFLFRSCSRPVQVAFNELNSKTPEDSFEGSVDQSGLDDVFKSEIRDISVKSERSPNSTSTASSEILNKTNKVGQCPYCFFTIMILSAPGYRDRRDAVRSNYLSRSRDRFNYVFLVGEGSGIDEEQNELGDLLIYPFQDSYDNLTDKVMWGFREIFNGTTSSGILKTDDDSFVNTTQLLALGDDITLFNGPFFGGFVRHPKEKERADPKFSSFWELRPEFEIPKSACPGPGYVLSRPTLKAVLAVHATKPVPFIIQIEDLYVSKLVEETGVTPTRLSVIPNNHWKRWKNLYAIEPYLILHNVTPRDFERITNFCRDNEYPL
eukprot:sb/3466461/